MLKYIITDQSITVLLKGIPKVIPQSHKNFGLIEEALKNKSSEEDINNLLDTSNILQEFISKSGNMIINHGEIIYQGEVINNSLSKRILVLKEKGFDITPFVLFMENLFKNISYRAVQELYGFLEACNLPITEDGYFLTYKKVRKDYMDCYSGTMDNSLGSTVVLPRNKVDEDSNNTCSYGLHVASYSYMAHYSGDRIVICKVSPEDVVAIPTDYNNSKMRVCKYEVIGEVELENDEIPDFVVNTKEIKNKRLKKLIKELVNRDDRGYNFKFMLDYYLRDLGYSSIKNYDNYKSMYKQIKTSISLGLDKKELIVFLEKTLKI